MTQSHILGFPRIGAERELKKALEAYWRSEISVDNLNAVSEKIQQDSWKIQADAGLDLVTVGDFSCYDHVLDTSGLLGVVPARFAPTGGEVNINTLFCMARGQAPKTPETTACEMTKWFNTNYHYIVPEFTEKQTFKLSTDTLFKAIDKAQALGYRVKPVLLGPLTYLWLGKTKGTKFDKLALLKKLLPVYNEILEQLRHRKIEWVQMDEPILALDLPTAWQSAYLDAYQQLNFGSLRCLLATYFGDLDDNLLLVKQLPVDAIHLDVAANPQKLAFIVSQWPENKILSAGIVNGRNIWKTDFNKVLLILQAAKYKLGDRLWVGSSCSLQHVPVDLDSETQLDAELKSWLAFAKQKVAEVSILGQVLQYGQQYFLRELAENKQALQSRHHSKRIHNAVVRQRLANLTQDLSNRQSDYERRAQLQRDALKLPLFPTTTIGSFPQTQEIRILRQDYKSGKIDTETYIEKIHNQIAAVIQKQEALDLDVLVHGEAERNDMVEYFGELLQGFAFSKNGWVQSYGSRCVKPPIIYGDVLRPEPITVKWTQYAQGLTNRPVKGMLTGPVTLLAWSFVRDDQPYSDTALQIALALRDEVTDLEKAGIQLIQIDEPAFREFLPLREKDWQSYLDWAVFCFRVSASGVQDKTQIHTHMCYSEFNDVIKAIANLDADVITIESSRSEMELLKAFESFAYPNEIGPGVFDIHSPRVPTTAEMVLQLEKAAKFIPLPRLWVNPDCGLKTRGWPEVELSLANMVAAAKLVREKYQEA